MTEHELLQKRLERWRLRQDLAPNDEKEVRAFIKESGFCHTYHVTKDTIPALLQTITGSTEPRPVFSASDSDPYHAMLNESFRIYAKQKLFVEVGIFGKHPVIVYRDVFTRLYRLMGSEIRGSHLSPRKRNSKLEGSIISFLDERGACSRKEMRLTLTGKRAGRRHDLTDALESLAKQLKVIRLRNSGVNGIEWTTPENWSPRLCADAARIDRDEAIEYLIIRLLGTAIAASRKSVRRFFKYVIPAEITDFCINSLIQRGIILVDQELIVDGKRGLTLRPRN